MHWVAGHKRLSRESIKFWRLTRVLTRTLEQTIPISIIQGLTVLLGGTLTHAKLPKNPGFPDNFAVRACQSGGITRTPPETTDQCLLSLDCARHLNFAHVH